MTWVGDESGGLPIAVRVGDGAIVVAVLRGVDGVGDAGQFVLIGRHCGRLRADVSEKMIQLGLVGEERLWLPEAA